MNKPPTPRAPPSFASLVQSFFTEYLTQQRAMSPCTVATYRDGFVLFLDFATTHLHKQPTTMKLPDITPTLILAFLDHLEHDRGNAVRTRNARLAALRAFLRFAGHRNVNALHIVEQAPGVPMKRFERPMLGFLSREEMLAIIGKPGPSWTSQRDHLLLHMLYNTGARVSEIIGVRLADVVRSSHNGCERAFELRLSRHDLRVDQAQLRRCAQSTFSRNCPDDRTVYTNRSRLS